MLSSGEISFTIAVSYLEALRAIYARLHVTWQYHPTPSTTVTTAVESPFIKYNGKESVFIHLLCDHGWWADSAMCCGQQDVLCFVVDTKLHCVLWNNHLNSGKFTEIDQLTEQFADERLYFEWFKVVDVFTGSNENNWRLCGCNATHNEV